MTPKYYWRILRSRLKDRRAVREAKDYFERECRIPRKKMVVIPHGGVFCLAWKIYPAELYHKQASGAYELGDVVQYKKWLQRRTAKVESWRRKRGKK